MRHFLQSLVSLIFLISVVLGSLIWALSYWQNSRPAAVVPVLARRFLLLVSRGDSADAYNMLTREARLDCGPDDFDAMWQPVPWKVSGVKLAKIDEHAAVVRYDRAFAGTPASRGYLYFQEGSDRWLLSYDGKAVREAEASLRSDDPDMAFLKAQAAVRISPWNPVGRGLLCEASYESGIVDSAKLQCATAVSLSAKYPSTLSAADVARFKSILASLGGQKVK